MSKKVWIGIVALLIVVAIMAAMWVSKQKEPVAIRIGAILPLTGDFASHGADAKRGIQLATQLANLDHLTPKPIEAVFEDDQMLPRMGVSAFQKLTEVDKVPVVIGGIGSSVALAIAPLAQRRQVVLISPTASNPKLSGAGPYFFRIWPSDAYEGKVMADFATHELRVRRCAVLFVNNDFGLSIKDVFVEVFSSQNGQIVSTESYMPSTSDFRAQLSNISASQTEAVYLPGYYTEVAAILKQAKELGISARFLAAAPVENPKLIELASVAAEGLLYTRPAFDPSDPPEEYVRFRMEYEKTFATEPGIAAAYAYDAASLVINAIAEGGWKAKSIRQRLSAVSNYAGATGKITFDANGDVIRDFAVFTVNKGNFEPYTAGTQDYAAD